MIPRGEMDGAPSGARGFAWMAALLLAALLLPAACQSYRVTTGVSSGAEVRELAPTPVDSSFGYSLSLGARVVKSAGKATRWQLVLRYSGKQPRFITRVHPLELYLDGERISLHGRIVRDSCLLGSCSQAVYYALSAGQYRQMNAAARVRVRLIAEEPIFFTMRPQLKGNLQRFYTGEKGSLSG